MSPVPQPNLQLTTLVPFLAVFFFHNVSQPMPWIPLGQPSFCHQWLSKWIACVILVYLIPTVLLGQQTALPRHAPLWCWLHPLPVSIYLSLSCVHDAASDSNFRGLMLPPSVKASILDILSSTLFVCVDLPMPCVLPAVSEQFSLHCMQQIVCQPPCVILVAMVDCNQWRNSDMQ